MEMGGEGYYCCLIKIIVLFQPFVFLNLLKLMFLPF